MARPTVPKFGNWETEDNVPYTIFFDKARKGKTGGKMINPNDPQENPEMFADIKTPPRPTPVPKSRPYTEPEEPGRRQTVRTTHDRRVSREESEYAPPNNNMGNRTGGSAHQRGGQGAGTGRQVRNSGGSDHSVDKSPLHPRYQGKVTPKGSASPAYDSSHGTPGRSRMKPNQSADSGAAVPRFGEWENDPSSAENYTDIFNIVRKEHAEGSPVVSGSDSRPNYNIPRKQEPKSKCCCFPW
ncbi:RPM1-interacting protein 4-like isoform X2 [Rutidosis leptorrhynchoides]|uniref:RPM1-interacting protein 4-like isoform X2 n=1 Tax=Rutidosis leptorrhynchoides TaxID=125765 RepID=UPI003A99A418